MCVICLMSIEGLRCRPGIKFSWGFLCRVCTVHPLQACLWVQAHLHERQHAVASMAEEKNLGQVTPLQCAGGVGTCKSEGYKLDWADGWETLIGCKQLRVYKLVDHDSGSYPHLCPPKIKIYSNRYQKCYH